MELQYIIDKKGHKSAVQLPINDWQQIQKELKELKKFRDKKSLLDDLKESIAEVALAKQGKIKLQSAKDFLNEL
jgi:hypothetical protein